MVFLSAEGNAFPFPAVRVRARGCGAGISSGVRPGEFGICGVVGATPAIDSTAEFPITVSGTGLAIKPGAGDPGAADPGNTRGGAGCGDFRSDGRFFYRDHLGFVQYFGNALASFLNETFAFGFFCDLFYRRGHFFGVDLVLIFVEHASRFPQEVIGIFLQIFDCRSRILFDGSHDVAEARVGENRSCFVLCVIERSVLGNEK